MNITDLSELDVAIRNLAQVAEAGGPGPWDACTCFEAEAVAEVLRVAGFPGAADAVIGDHSTSDSDCDDMHHAEYLELTGTTKEECGCDEEESES